MARWLIWFAFSGPASRNPRVPASRARAYSEDEVDLFGVYAGEVDRCFLIPASHAVGKSMLHLRLAPPRNNQSACITLGADYEFSGAIAQLGERSAGSRKVAGSNPASSTAPPDPITIGSARSERSLAIGWNASPVVTRCS